MTMDSRSSRITGAFVLGRCAACDTPIVAARVEGDPLAAVEYVEPRPDGPWRLTTEGLLRPAEGRGDHARHVCPSAPSSASTRSSSTTTSAPPRKTPRKRKETP